MPPLEAVIFLSLWAFGLGQFKLEQPVISISRTRGESAQIPCKVSSGTFSSDSIHWYRQKPDQSMEHLIYVVSTTLAGGKNNKLEASKEFYTSTSTLRINFLEKEDEAVYFCACWTGIRWIKIFAEGTQLIVIPGDKSYGPGYYPKPTIFHPSAAEVSLHKAGTHICLLEKFFPDVIKVYWKEKNGDTILESQQGNTMKTDDTYMKFSWLTVSEESMNKEHKCIVKHEHNKVDQEILFPAINVSRGPNVPWPRPWSHNSLDSELQVLSINTTDQGPVLSHVISHNSLLLDDCGKSRYYILQLQLINTSAYYTYLLLLLKSLVYFAVISFCLVRRTAVCDHGKS
uniref:Ig-like domain-containing protein n=1 Tax=Myotis lucifugus TaxID=59463 RepID=G1Q2S5_MYOLU